MRRLLAITAVSVVALSATAPHISGPGFPGRPAGVTHVEVMVEDGKGKPVSGLTANDFQIWSDGQRRPIDAFSSPSATTQLTLVVLVDISASKHNCPCCVVLLEPLVKTVGTGRGGMPGISTAPAGVIVDEFQMQGLRSTDRVQVGSIGRRLTMREGFTSDAAEIKRNWRSLFDVPPVEYLGPSPIWDAVADAAAVLVEQPGHRAIVLITDGQSTGNRYGHREVSARVALAGVSVSIVAEESMLPTLPLTSMASYGVDPTRPLQTMADVTGGGFELTKAEFAPQGNCFRRDPTLLLRRALDRLHQAYTLGFVPQVEDGKTHTLDVRVTKPGMVVRARRIYVAGPPR